MGLVNRVVEPGTARAAAEALAADLAALPQTCLRNDRLSLLHGEALPLEDAMAYELEVGLESLTTDGVSGAGRFAGGSGRHGE